MKKLLQLYSKKGSVWLFDTSVVVPRKRISGGGTFVGGRNVRRWKSGGSIFNLRPLAELLPPLWSPVPGNEISARSRFAEIVVHKGNFLLVAVEVSYKKRFDVLCERMAGGSFLCHSLTCASRCEVTCGDRVMLSASDFFCLDKTGSLSMGSQEPGHELVLSSAKKGCVTVCIFRGKGVV